MTEQTDISRVAELMARGFKDAGISTALGITRHEARKLIAQVEREKNKPADVFAREDAMVLDPEPVTPVTPDEYAEKILLCWRRSVEGIIDTGRWLERAKQGIGHGFFLRMIEEKLPFSEDTAQKLMRIAGNPWLTNTDHARYLPASWTALAELARLEPTQLDSAVRSGVLNPNMGRADVLMLRAPDKPLDGEILPSERSTNTNPVASLAPEGEAHQGINHAAGLPQNPAGAPPRPYQGSVVSSQRSEESEVMPSENIREFGEGTAPGATGVPTGSDTPPRQDQSDAGGAEDVPLNQRLAGPLEFAPSVYEADARIREDQPAYPIPARDFPEPKPAWNASRITPKDSRDFFPTGPWITRTLFEKVLPHVGIRPNDWCDRSVWEPACGEGHMAEVVREYGPQVFASDIHDYGYQDAHVIDFLKPSDDAGMFGWIITNPPYNGRALEFALRALDLALDGVALFTSVQWVAEGKERYERLFKDRPPTLIAFFVERAPIHENQWLPNGGTKQAYCWVVWRKDRKPKAPFWIPPGCRESLTRPDDAERFTKHPVQRKEHALALVRQAQQAPQVSRAVTDVPDIPAFLDRRAEQTEGTH